MSSPEPYAWPLDPPRAVTSSFAEYRGGRYHAGIDLRAEVGQPVYAPADGYVSRVRCSPWGYGKVIYLQLTDGNLMVFAHLSAFVEPLASCVRRAQHAAKEYTVELNPGPSEFVFKRGDRIAFTGRTGTVDPHLHFEPRDAEGCPISPRRLGMEWPDTTAPIVNKLVVVPKTPTSRINGDILPAVRDVRRTEGTRYTCDPLRVSGEIGFGVDLVDPANNGENKLCIHTVRTTLGAEEVFVMRMDRFSYGDRADEIVSYYPFLNDRGHFLLQWRWPGNDCEIYRQTKSNGWASMPNHTTQATLEIKDFYGNEATVSIPLESEKDDAPDPVPPAKTESQGGKGTVEVECVYDWLAVTAQFPTPEPEVPMLQVEGADTAPEFFRVDARTFRAAVAPGKAAQELVIRVTHPRMDAHDQHIQVFRRGGGARAFEAAGTTLSVASDSPYGVLFVRAFPANQSSSAPIPMRGEPVRFWPAAMPIDVPVHIRIPVPASVQEPARAGVYRDNGDGWTFEDAKRTSAGFDLSTTRFGAFAVLEDTQPPRISEIQVIAKPGVPQRPEIRAKVADVGSGIATANVTVDGRWLLAAYDPEQSALVWERDEDLPENAQELLFTVTDKAGNSVSATHRLSTPKSTPAKPKQPSHKAGPQKPKPSQPKSRK